MYSLSMENSLNLYKQCEYGRQFKSIQTKYVEPPFKI